MSIFSSFTDLDCSFFFLESTSAMSLKVAGFKTSDLFQQIKDGVDALPQEERAANAKKVPFFSSLFLTIFLVSFLSFLFSFLSISFIFFSISFQFSFNFLRFSFFVFFHFLLTFLIFVGHVTLILKPFFFSLCSRCSLSLFRSLEFSSST